MEEIKKQAHKEFDERKWQHWHTKCSQFVEIPDSLKDQLKSFIDSLIDKTVQISEERVVGVINNELEIQKKVQEKSKEIVAIGRVRVAGMVAEKYTRIGKIEALEDLKSLITNKSDNKLK